MRAYPLPFSEESLGDRLFRPRESREAIAPAMESVRESLRERGIELYTADLWRADAARSFLASPGFRPFSRENFAEFLRAALTGEENRIP